MKLYKALERINDDGIEKYVLLNKGFKAPQGTKAKSHIVALTVDELKKFYEMGSIKVANRLAEVPSVEERFNNCTLIDGVCEVADYLRKLNKLANVEFRYAKDIEKFFSVASITGTSPQKVTDALGNIIVVCSRTDDKGNIVASIVSDKKFALRDSAYFNTARYYGNSCKIKGNQFSGVLSPVFSNVNLLSLTIDGRLWDTSKTKSIASLFAMSHISKLSVSYIDFTSLDSYCGILDNTVILELDLAECKIKNIGEFIELLKHISVHGSSKIDLVNITADNQQELEDKLRKFGSEVYSCKITYNGEDLTLR